MQSSTHDRSHRCTVLGIKIIWEQKKLYFPSLLLSISLKTFSHWHGLWSIVWEGRGSQRQRMMGELWNVCVFVVGTVRETGEENRLLGLFKKVIFIAFLFKKKNWKVKGTFGDQHSQSVPEYLQPEVKIYRCLSRSRRHSTLKTNPSKPSSGRKSNSILTQYSTIYATTDLWLRSTQLCINPDLLSDD